jgi:predicted Zn-dependent protease
LNTVAEICFARGKKDEAIEAINRAIDEEPNNLLYQNQLERFQGGQNVGE